MNIMDVYRLQVVFNVGCLVLVNAIDHGTNLIWAQTPFAKLSSVSRLVSIQGDPNNWIVNKKPVVTYISAPQMTWEFKALGFLWTDHLVYWSESTHKKIQSLVLNGTTDSETLFAGTSSEVHGLAVDWLSRNLYFTDALYDWIILITIDPGKHFYKIIVNDQLDSPHGLAVDPIHGYLFWSDWGEKPQIEKSNLIGERRVTLVDRNIVQPRGLTVDYATGTLYWVDSAKGFVESISIEGTEREIFYTDEGSFFYSVAVYGSYLFVTEKKRGALKVFNRQKSLVSFTLGNQPFDIIMYDKSQQPGNSSECFNMGCDQICVQDPATGPVCLCGDGYVLDVATNKTCKASKKFIHPSHVYAIQDAICQYPANLADMSLVNVSLDSQCFLEDKQGYTTLTFDARENMLYYFVNNTKIISRIPLEMGGRAKVVTGGSGEVKGMALDWVAGNLYWTDSTYGVIKVAKKTGPFQKILLSELNNPVAIAVHPGRGEIYWTDHGHLPDVGGKVEKAYMDGTGRKIILGSNIGQPNHMFVDYDKNLLYWADSILYHVKQYDLVTGQVEIFFEQANVKFYGLSLFRDYILWTDTEDLNGIHVARLDKKEKVRGIIHPKNGVASDLVTFDIQNQPDINNSCNEGRNRCDQLCLVSSGNFSVCACGSGFELSFDGMTCKRALSSLDNFLLVNDAYQKMIYQVDLKSAVVGAIKIFPIYEPVALTYDPVDFKVFWSDNKQHIIKQVNIDGQYERTLLFFNNDSNCDGLAADYVNKLLFYTDTGNNVIGVASMLNYDYNIVLISENLDEPRDIVISPNQGLIYWSDWGNKPAIEKANMDGTDRETILSLQANSWPNGLALDVKANKLYWVDANADTISVIDLLNKSSTVLLHEPGAHYFSLDISGDYLFVTDWKKNFLRRMNKLGGPLYQFGDSIFTRLYGIKVFNSTEAFRGISICVASACEHLCLPSANNFFTCRCAKGFRESGPACIRDGETLVVESTPSATATSAAFVTTIPPDQTISTTNQAQSTALPTDFIDMFSTSMSLMTNDFSTDVMEVDTTFEPIDTTEISTVDSTSTSYQDLSTAVAKSIEREQRMSPLFIGVIIGAVILLVAVVVVIVAVVTWRRYKYKPRHNRLIEDNPSDFYTIAFAAPGDEAVKFDDAMGIENPIYDCLNDPTIVINTGGDVLS
ncbi:low-density lipoprotein receptor-related protein 4-like isoform X2 [Biomphalaria glabrata]|uniref:Low-density lipoprotein receptor-related protein 4-like isoform X2 n=1 Tax=Biomphalaria glabrata TaxID=6526 RepID=A0A9W2Z0I2_BIOGL|nr:low-density lipoprotein receptor-related protein 4-like isoform X2 [Biomphalaria glabrata]